MAQKAIYKKYEVIEESYTYWVDGPWYSSGGKVTTRAPEGYTSYYIDQEKEEYVLSGDRVTYGAGKPSVLYVRGGAAREKPYLVRYRCAGPGSYLGDDQNLYPYRYDEHYMYAQKASGIRYLRGSLVEETVLDKGSVATGERAEDGYWYEFYKDMVLPPPAQIQYAALQAGTPFELTCSAVEDAYSQTISYVWEQSVDGGVYVQAGVTTAPKLTGSVPETGDTFQARVKVVNNYGVESVYCMGEMTAIIRNTPPAISGEDEDLGEVVYPPYCSCIVTDTNPGDTLYLTETVTNGNDTLILRSEEEVQSGETLVSFLYDPQNIARWLTLLPGEHRHRMIIRDAGGEQAVRTWTFRRKVDRIAVSRCVGTDVMPEKVFLSIFPSPQELPAGCTVTCEVCNDPYGQKEWEDCTDCLNKESYTFVNTTSGARPGFAYRIRMEKGTAAARLDQVTVRLA